MLKASALNGWSRKRHNRRGKWDTVKTSASDYYWQKPYNFLGHTKLRGIYESFDPRKAALDIDLSEVDWSKCVRTEAGVETGQLCGVFSEDSGTPDLRRIMRFTAMSQGKVVMPANYALQHPDMVKDPFDIKFRSKAQLAEFTEETGVRVGPPSAHCMAWSWLILRLDFPDAEVLVSDFVPAEVLAQGREYAADWVEDYLCIFMEYTAEVLGHKLITWFWSLYMNAVMHQGYEWPFGKDKLALEGLDKFREATAALRKLANRLGIKLGQELHNGTGAASPDEMQLLIAACDHDPCLAVWGDGSHCDEGEDPFQRNSHPVVMARCVGTHGKVFDIWEGIHGRKIEMIWAHRRKRFTGHDQGAYHLKKYVEDCIAKGFGHRYAALTANSLGDNDYLRMSIMSEAEHWLETLVTPEEIAAVSSDNWKNIVLPEEVWGASHKGMFYVAKKIAITQAAGQFTDTMAG